MNVQRLIPWICLSGLVAGCDGVVSPLMPGESGCGVTGVFAARPPGERYATLAIACGLIFVSFLAQAAASSFPEL